jgi:sterol desaturase/sphingolipid hydroxylase (fatty acid hydroxylase superfamily)
MLVFLDRFFSAIAGEIDQYLILPLLYHFGWMEWEELSFDWVLICVYGLFAVVVTYAICWPLEAFFPIERWDNRKAVFVDALYTIINRVGVLPVVSFLVFYEAQVMVNGFVVAHGYIPPTLEMLVPPLLGHQVITFIVYALILDCADYWRHRLSHSFRSWYALHALHHAQRQMSFWSDDRNHLLDDLIAALWFGVVGLAIGIPPLQFPLLFLFMRFIESLSQPISNCPLAGLATDCLSRRAFTGFITVCAQPAETPATTAPFSRSGTCCFGLRTSQMSMRLRETGARRSRWRAAGTSPNKWEGCNSSSRSSGNRPLDAHAATLDALTAAHCADQPFGWLQWAAPHLNDRTFNARRRVGTLNRRAALRAPSRRGDRRAAESGRELTS